MIAAIWYEEDKRCCHSSCTHLVIPDGMNLTEQRTQWGEWFKDVYCEGKPYDSRRVAESGIDYISFIQWLINNGARPTNGNELIEFEETDA